MLSEHDARKIIINNGVSIGTDDPRSSVEIALTIMETGSPCISERAIGSAAVRAQVLHEQAMKVPKEAVQDAIIYFSGE